jgi:CDP-diglyceride synthetase
MNTAKPVSSVAWPARIASFALEALKLIGIALACFVVIGGVTLIFVQNGIVIPSRWFGLSFWTGFLVWIICRMYRSNLTHSIFWVTFSILLSLHLAVFIVVLRTYPEWRMAWFPLVAIVEVPCIAMALDVLQRKHRAH